MLIREVDLGRTFKLAVLADTHIGNAATSESAIRKAVKKIKCPWVFLGDATESIHLGDKRYAPQIHEGRFATINAQVERWLELFDPIRKNCIAVLDGNHEEKIEHVADVGEMIGKEWGVIVGARTLHATFTPTFKAWLTHGSGATNSRAEHEDRREFNDCDAIRKKLTRKSGDCHLACMGHIHKMRLRPPATRLYLTTKSGRLKQNYSQMHQRPDGYVHEDYRWFCSTGSFLRTFMEGVTTYSEKFGYDPVEMGYLLCTVKQGFLADIEKVYV